MITTDDLTMTPNSQHHVFTLSLRCLAEVSNSFRLIKKLLIFTISSFCIAGVAFTATAQSSQQTTPYKNPYIDIDEWRDDPVRHRYVHGGFSGSELRFSIYFPPKESYQGRFFQPLQAVSGSENAAPMALYRASGVDFAIATGGYLVESNQGSRNMYGGDSLANVAVAEYSRQLAREMYGEHRPYGYIYGGSGGAFKTLGCVENHPSVWDGSIPFVHGSPIAIPHVFTVQAHAMRILWDKFPQIVDALEPGGSGDMYAGLNEEEKAALAEVTGMGFPPRAWFNYEKIAYGYTGVFSTLVDSIRFGDPQYFEDFWTKPGYLGANPPTSLKSARVQQDTAISSLVMPEEIRAMGIPLTMSTSQTNSGVKFPAALRVKNLPEGNLVGASIIMKSGAAKGNTFYVAGVVNDMLMIGFGATSFQGMAKIRAGDDIAIDNSVYLASQTFHRHQIQAPEYYVWDQFKDEKGKPVYPQRPLLSQQQSGGSSMSGNFTGKMMVLHAMMDEAAYPWQGDWFKSRVKKAQGKQFDDKYRLYYIDNTMHTTQLAKPGDPAPVATTRVISYQGALQQALRDLVNWVENDVEPPKGSGYHIDGGQVILEDSAKKRGGLQPLVSLKAEGKSRADVNIGEKVDFKAKITVPPNAGKIIKVEWDFDGNGNYPQQQIFDGKKAKASATLKSNFTYDKSGTYFPAVRVTTEKNGDANAKYALVQNIGRVRVVVE